MHPPGICQSGDSRRRSLPEIIKELAVPASFNTRARRRALWRSNRSTKLRAEAPQQQAGEGARIISFLDHKANSGGKAATRQWHRCSCGSPHDAWRLRQPFQALDREGNA